MQVHMLAICPASYKLSMKYSQVWYCQSLLYRYKMTCARNQLSETSFKVDERPENMEHVSYNNFVPNYTQVNSISHLHLHLPRLLPRLHRLLRRLPQKKNLQGHTQAPWVYYVNYVLSMLRTCQAHVRRNIDFQRKIHACSKCSATYVRGNTPYCRCACLTVEVETCRMKCIVETFTLDFLEPFWRVILLDPVALSLKAWGSSLKGCLVEAQLLCIL